MPLLDVPRPGVGNRLPRGPYRISRSSPQARGLEIWTPFGQPGSTRDLSGNGLHGALVGTPPAVWTPTRWGQALDFDRAAANSVSFGDLARFDGVTRMSFAAWIIIDDDTTDQIVTMKGDFRGGGNSPITFWRDEFGGISGRTDTFTIAVSGTATTQLEGASGIALASPEPRLVGFTYDTVDGTRLYYNGVEDPNSPGAAQGTLGSIARVLQLGGGSDSGSDSFGGKILDARWSLDLWSAADFRHMYQAGTRWNLYRDARRLAVPVAPSGATPQTRSGSLEAAVRGQKQQIGSLGAALRVRQALTTGTDAGIARLRFSSAALDAASERTAAVVHALEAAVQRFALADTGLDANIGAEGAGLRQAGLDAVLAGLISAGSRRSLRVPPGQRSAPITDDRRSLN